jgi:hypothetical protein
MRYENQVYTIIWSEELSKGERAQERKELKKTGERII